jgi:large subunit ribosomal protein L9
MKVILNQDVKHVGFKDDVVTVKNGYAANYLIPKGLAHLATESAMKVLTENQKQRAFKEEKIRNEAVKLANSLKDMTVKVGAKAGENGKIFGSVTTIQISEAIKKLGFEVDRKSIHMDEESIKNLGSYTAKAKLYKDVVAEINFEVVAE